MNILNKKISNEKIIIGIILIIFAALISLQSSASIINVDSYLSTDVAVWTNIGKMMSEGKVMYRDIFDHKGPILLILYCLAYTMGKNIGIWILDFISILISEFIIYKIARKFNLNKVKSVLVVAIGLIFLSHLCIENPCTESLALPFILLSLYEFIKFTIDIKQFGRKESICTGICLGIILLLRPNLASLWVIYDLYIFIKLLKERKVKELLNIILFSILGVAIIFIPIMIYLLINNAFKDFIDTYLIFNLKYAKSKELTLLQTIVSFIENDNLDFVIFIGSIYLILLGYMYQKKDKKLITIITSFIYFLFTFYLVIMPQRSYSHYLIPMLPTLIIPVAISLKYLEINKYIGTAIIAIAMIYISLMLYFKIENWKKDWSYTTYLRVRSKYIQENTNKDDSILQIGNQAGIYLMADREYKGKYFYQIPIAFYSEEICDEVLNEIKEDLPKIIINRCNLGIYSQNIEGKFKKEITKILEENYIKKNNTIYIRKGENFNE